MAQAAAPPPLPPPSVYGGSPGHHLDGEHDGYAEPSFHDDYDHEHYDYGYGYDDGYSYSYSYNYDYDYYSSPLKNHPPPSGTAYYQQSWPRRLPQLSLPTSTTSSFSSSSSADNNAANSSSDPSASSSPEYSPSLQPPGIARFSSTPRGQADPRTTAAGQEGNSFVCGPVAEDGWMKHPSQSASSSTPRHTAAVPTTPVPAAGDTNARYQGRTQTQSQTQSHTHFYTDADGARVKDDAAPTPRRTSSAGAASLTDADRYYDDDKPDDEERVVAYYGPGADDDDDERENAFIILLRVSFLAPPFSFAAALYTLLILLFFILTSPLRIFPLPFLQNTPGLPTQLQRVLLPVLRQHQRLICPSSYPASATGTHRRRRHRRHRPHGHNPYRTSSPGSSSTSSSPSLSPSPTSWSFVLLLVSIHLLSPILILPLVFASWTAACFWLFTMVLGDPGSGSGGATRRNDDGRVAVLAVRNWWRAWLCSGDSRPTKADARTPTRAETRGSGRRGRRSGRRGRNRHGGERPEMRERGVDST